MATFGNLVQEPNAGVFFDSWWAFQYNVIEAGTVVTFHAYIGVRNAVANIEIGLFDDTGADYPKDLLGETGEVNPDGVGWKSWAPIAPINFSAGKHWLVLGQDSALTAVNCHLGTQDQALMGTYKPDAGGVDGAILTPFAAGGGANGHDVSIYVTYTPSGAPKGTIAVHAKLARIISILQEPPQLGDTALHFRVRSVSGKSGENRRAGRRLKDLKSILEELKGLRLGGR